MCIDELKLEDIPFSRSCDRESTWDLCRLQQRSNAASLAQWLSPLTLWKLNLSLP